MEEIYGEKGAPVARETNYYESQRNRREENFAPSYQEQPYRRQEHRDETFHQQQSGEFSKIRIFLNFLTKLREVGTTGSIRNNTLACEVFLEITVVAR